MANVVKKQSAADDVVKQPLFISTFRGEHMIVDLQDKKGEREKTLFAEFALEVDKNNKKTDKLAYQTVGDVMSAVEHLWGIPKERLCFVSVRALPLLSCLASQHRRALLRLQRQQ